MLKIIKTIYLRLCGHIVIGDVWYTKAQWHEIKTKGELNGMKFTNNS